MEISFIHNDLVSNKVMRVFNFIGKYFIYIAVVVYLIPVVSLASRWKRNGFILELDWKISAWRVNYFDFGFIKRGFIGTLLAFVPDKYLMIISVLFYSCVIYVFLFVVYYSFKRLLLNQVSVDSVNILKSLFVLSPLVLFQYSYDVCRFDLMNMILLISSIYLVYKRRLFYIVVLLSVVAILIHEAFMVYGVPLILLYIIYIFSKKDTVVYVLSYVVPLVFVSFSVYMWGNSEKVKMMTYGAGSGVWTRGLLEPGIGDNMGQTIILISIILLIYSWLYYFYKENSNKKDLLYYSTFSPLCLFLMGTDAFRWLSIIFCVVFIVFFVKIREGWRIPQGYKLVIPVIMIIPLGPIGIRTPFPFIESLLKFFHV